MMPNIFLIQALSCAFLCGLIWTIQVVHYPGFQYVDPAKFHEFHKFHTSSITYVVGPLMLLELVTALWLCLMNPNAFWLANLGSILLIWLATALVSVPLHTQLEVAFSIDIAQKLVLTNWIRTFLWSARTIALGAALALSLKN